MILGQSMVAVAIVLMSRFPSSRPCIADCGMESNMEMGSQGWRGPYSYYKQFWPGNTYNGGTNGPLDWWSGGSPWPQHRGAIRPLEQWSGGGPWPQHRGARGLLEWRSGGGPSSHYRAATRPPHPGWGAPPTPKPKPKHPGW